MANGNIDKKEAVVYSRRDVKRQQTGTFSVCICSYYMYRGLAIFVCFICILACLLALLLFLLLTPKEEFSIRTLYSTKDHQ